MCGILGVANASGVPISRTTIEKMRDTMAHRGPDDDGIYSDATVTLAHRRLSIIDLGGGYQPMSNPEETVWVIHDGEIYNFMEVRRELEAAGFTFRTKSDTEVIVRAYEKWGEGCVETLHGIFAFAVWDTKSRRLLVARDRLGIKPLFYAATLQGFYIGSEIKSFLADPSFDRSIDAAAVDRYFTFGYIPAPDTIFQNVKKLMPGHYLVWENGRVRIERYWRFEPYALPEDDDKFEADWLDELRDVLRRAVARQMASDVPLGAFLSGGIDSSLVVRMMSEVSPTPVRTFTIDFGGDKTSETPYAKTVAERFLTDHQEFQVTADTMEEILPKLVWHLDEPFADSSAIPTYYLSKITREKVTVALSGDGGDELFAGYTRHQGERLSEQFRSFPPWMRSAALGVLGSPVARGSAGLRRLGHVLSNAELGFITRYHNKEMLSQEIDRRALYSQAFRSAVGEHDVVHQLEELAQATANSDSIGRLTAFDLEFYLPNDMLVKVDKMSMASSLEVRVPFLDELVMDIAARIPSDLKLKGYTTKYLLRKLASESLPKEIFKRKKQGFGIPLQSWFRGKLTNYSREMLFDDRTLSRGYFDREAVEVLLQEHEERTFDHGQMIYALIVFELWNRTFIDRRGA
jgi:asparagine synthase (glutamine-hydrolysing)